MNCQSKIPSFDTLPTERIYISSIPTINAPQEYMELLADSLKRQSFPIVKMSLEDFQENGLKLSTLTSLVGDAPSYFTSAKYFYEELRKMISEDSGIQIELDMSDEMRGNSKLKLNGKIDPPSDIIIDLNKLRTFVINCNRAVENEGMLLMRNVNFTNRLISHDESNNPVYRSRQISGSEKAYALFDPRDGITPLDGVYNVSLLKDGGIDLSDLITHDLASPSMNMTSWRDLPERLQKNGIDPKLVNALLYDLNVFALKTHPGLFIDERLNLSFHHKRENQGNDVQDIRINFSEMKKIIMSWQDKISKK